MTKQFLVHIKKWITRKADWIYSARVMDSNENCIFSLEGSKFISDREAILHVAINFLIHIEGCDKEELLEILNENSFIVISRVCLREEMIRWGMEPHG